MLHDLNYPPEVSSLLQEKKFATAIKRCQSCGLNSQGISELIKKDVNLANRYFEEKKYDEAMTIYLTTIGAIEPSIVLCKFFAPHLTFFLTTYLIELHKKGFSTEQHTKLLFNLFHQRDIQPRLDDFIKLVNDSKLQFEQKQIPKRENSSFSLSFLRKEKEENIKIEDLTIFYLHFQKTVGAAIEVLIQNDMQDHAFKLSSIMPISSQLLSLLIYNQKKYHEASLMIMEQCNHPTGRQLLMEHGPAILNLKINDCPDEESKKKLPEAISLIAQAAAALWKNDNEGNDKEFIKLFWGHPKSLYNFLKIVCSEYHTILFGTTLINLLIPRNDLSIEEQKKIFFGHPDIASYDEALKYITDNSLRYDENQIIFICTECKFIKGVISVLEKLEKYQNIANFYISQCEEILKINKNKLKESLQPLIEWCLTKPPLSPNDWYYIFQFFVKIYSNDLNISIDFFQNLITHIKDIRPFTSIIEELSSNELIPIEIIQKDINKELEILLFNYESELNENQLLEKELIKIESEIQNLEEGDIEFKPMTCDYCDEKLEIPYFGFFCHHNIHEHCCKYHSNGIPKCPLCETTNIKKFILENNLKEKINIENQNIDLFESVISLINNHYLD